MKKLILIFTLFFSFANSQNLVPNWSFESFTVCPNLGGQITYAVPWFGPTSNSSDYYNSCATIASNLNVPYQGGGGFQYAKDGNAFGGIYLLNGFGTNYREYLQVKLMDSLANGVCYYVEFYANLHNSDRFATNNVAANFSSLAYPTTYTSISTMTALNVPQHITMYGNPIIKDTMNWVKISGLFIGSGTEKYISLGNFKDNLNTDTMTIYKGPGNYYGTYCFFDAVSVYSINPTGPLPWSYSNTAVNIGDSVYIGNTMGGSFSSNWYTLPGNVFIKNAPGLYVKPVVTTTYVVTFTLCGVPHSDTLKVTVNNVGTNELEIKNEELVISPNPNNGLFQIEILNNQFAIEASASLSTEIRIQNLLGEEIKKEKLFSKKQSIDISYLKSGVYFLQLIQSNQILLSKKIIKE